MRKIEPSEILDLVEYEKARDALRAQVIALKRRRRVQLGGQISVVFENRATVLFQIQEMVRTERIVQAEKLRDEVDVYNGLIPGPGELSATLFIEIVDLHMMSQQQVRDEVNRFRGLDRDAVGMQVGAARVPARFEEGHTSEEKMAAVHYLRFVLPDEVQAALADPSAAAHLVVDHPGYHAREELSADVREELLRDLRA